MEKGRRDFMKMGAAAAVGALLPSGARSDEPASGKRPAVPPAPAGGQLRLLSFAPKPGDTVRVGALLASGRIVDLGEAAKRLKMKLSFEAAQMVSLIAGGEAALAEVRALLAKAPDGGPRPEEVRLV